MDEQLIHVANGACGRWEWLDEFMTVLDSGRPFFACLALALLLPLACHRDRARRDWLAALLVMALAVVVATLAGRLIAGVTTPRPRPLQVLNLNAPRGVSPDSWRHAALRGRPDTSLPSTHAILAAAAGFCLVWWRAFLGAAVGALGCLLMIPPVLYFGLHWPSDVAASLALAAVTGWLCARWRGRFAGAGRVLDGLLSRHPWGATLCLCSLAGLVTWRATPRSGVMDALTQAIRSLFS